MITIQELEMAIQEVVEEVGLVIKMVGQMNLGVMEDVMDHLANQEKTSTMENLALVVDFLLIHYLSKHFQ